MSKCGWFVFLKELNLSLQEQSLGLLLSSSEKAAQLLVTSRENCPTDGQGVRGNSPSTINLYPTRVEENHANKEVETTSMSKVIVGTGRETLSDSCSFQLVSKI